MTDTIPQPNATEAFREPVTPMTKARRIKNELKELRRECIDGTDDVLLKRFAYEIECAVRYVTEDGIRGWPNLSELARGGAQMLRNELDRKTRFGES